MRKIIKKIRRENDGSFTLEATMLFPILLIIVLLFVFFSLVIYEKVTLQYKANQIASRMAQTWGSSTMDIVTGELGRSDYVTQNGDGLYWRITSNNGFNKFGLSLSDNGVVTKKKQRVGEYAGNVTFDNGLFLQEIVVSLDKDLALPSSLADIFGVNKVGATARHPVVDQTEIIRNTDFMVYGFQKFTTYASKYIPFFNRNEEN
ncbi:pilus assembly protein [Ornithinibacillus sp. BX22]|uniref:Pilus assembly protein n=2 Tax=Ornithinibacillus TaxID=484508 RepID=A0A923L6G5_9BACI|nr:MULTISPECIES: TadE/TadG family type IV pilus assembly protein [Ornithinibacillus]MBC5637334.1 pilus assembly protein [Ornithinibacillus hominis]MBS3680359.1 pilus assembly protein [Ornithinibacillus massiliensis]